MSKFGGRCRQGLCGLYIPGSVESECTHQTKRCTKRAVTKRRRRWASLLSFPPKFRPLTWRDAYSLLVNSRFYVNPLKRAKQPFSWAVR